jgi:putative membrane-bound dehydrogenase-like protein
MLPRPSPPPVRPRALLFGILGWLATSATGQEPAPPASAMVRVPDGFEVVEYAGDDLAHDIYALTLDSQGRVAVSGAGYVKLLIDQNGDGRAESTKTFATGPKTGAQGMFFHGRTLLCVGDAGLLRYRDQNGDDVADGPPDVMLKLATGGEHDAHSIQQGPDGWWYLIAGNSANITAGYASLPTSPVKHPRAGALLRFAPDLSASEIVADGLRNAYDFTFNDQGDLFTYDSDDERDVSLPWYRPTRVFQLLPGADCGWVSRSWKRPNYFLDMPPVLGSFGRGSPTGLTCYRHSQFPAEYRHAIFALDWTYGRVLCLKLKPSGSTWTATADVFMSGLNGYGFAPTDCDVGPDGSLYVSVGGRGTRGAVYRVRAKGAPNTLPPPAAPLEACLTAPMPLSAWSRAVWMPQAKSLGREAFLTAARDERRPISERVRAIEILTELFGGIEAESARQLTAATPSEVRARTIWSYGRTQGAKADVAVLLPYLNDLDPFVARLALEAAQNLTETADWPALIKPIARRLGGGDRFTRSLASALVARMPPPHLPALSQAATEEGARAVVSYAAGWMSQPGIELERVRKSMSPVVVTILRGDYPPELKLDSLRLLQGMLGDLGPSKRHAAAFDGYSPGIDPDELERDWDELRIQLAELYPTGLPVVDMELSRVLAMLAPVNQALLDRVLKPMTKSSDPIDDLHQLLVAARLPVPRSTAQRQVIAEALVQFDAKFAARNLPQDSSWNDRIKDLYNRLCELDEFLAPVMVDVAGFGRPGHVLFMSQMPERRLADAIAAFAKQAAADAEYPWNNDVVFLFGASADPAHRALIKQQYDRFAVRGAVLMTLAEQPDAADRAWFREGLESSQVEVVAACLTALEQLPPDTGADEQLALLTAFRRLGQDEREYAARERVVKLLERNTNQKLVFDYGPTGYKPQTEAVAAWSDWVHKQYPDAAAAALGAVQSDLALTKLMMAKADWTAGDPTRGALLYNKRACMQCHGGRTALGPDLTGVTGRFSKEDLFTAIVAPSRDVSARYQTTIIATKDGKSFSGLIVYEAVDGLLLRNATHQTFRIETSQIEERRKSPVSLMPAGLMKDATPADYADLYAYLATLGKSVATPITGASAQREE